MSQSLQSDYFSQTAYRSDFGGEGLIAGGRRDIDSSSWSIPLLCIGIAVIACCVLVPAADENRQLTIANERLQADITQIKKQIAVNDSFIKSVADNPTMLERLAQRQMKLVRSGEAVLKLKDNSCNGSQMSPYLLLNLPPPAMASEPTMQQPNLLTRLTNQPRMQLYAIGGALLLMATSLVLGAASREAHH